jgi:uncharacterized protein YukE
VSEVDVVRSALRTAAKSLDGNVRTFTGPGSLSDLQSRGAVTAQHLGNWDAGQALARTTDQAYQQLTRAYSDFMSDYRDAISALLKTAERYAETEQENLNLIRALLGKQTDRSER